MKSISKTILNMAAICFLSQNHLVSASDVLTASDYKDCLSCAISGPNARICRPEGIGIEDDKVVCCTSINNEKSFCDTKVEENKCMTETAGFTTNSQSKLANECPSNVPEKCGNQKIITAYEESQTYGQQNMRYIFPSAPGGFKISKLPSYQTCSWTFKPENAKWQTGKITVNFKTKPAGMFINLWASYNGQLLKPLLEDGKQPVVGESYSVDATRYNMTVIAAPYFGSTDTDFEFDFKAEGVEWPMFLQGGEQMKYEENAETWYLLSAILGSLFLCMCIGAPIGCCIICCCRGCGEKQPGSEGNRIYDTAQITDLSVNK